MMDWKTEDIDLSMEEEEPRQPEVRVEQILTTGKEQELFRQQPRTSLGEDQSELKLEGDIEDADPDARCETGARSDTRHQEEAGQDAMRVDEDAEPEARHGGGARPDAKHPKRAGQDAMQDKEDAKPDARREIRLYSTNEGDTGQGTQQAEEL